MVEEIKEMPQLNQDYALLQFLLQCHTCTWSNKSLLYRAPNCENKKRPHFAALKHDAQLHGKCPYHDPMDAKILAFHERSMHDVYSFGKFAYAWEQQKIKDRLDGRYKSTP